MKITGVIFALLLVLALCSQYAESCLPFYVTFTTVTSRSPSLLELDLQKYKPTSEEVESFKKIQECYSEHSLGRTIKDALLMLSISLSEECLQEVESSLPKLMK